LDYNNLNIIYVPLSQEKENEIFDFHAIDALGI
jgi:hypothetical protein